MSKRPAHLLHLVKNHPFVDGNKRTGLVAMLAFLGLNGRRLEAPDDDLTDLVLGVAEGRVTKAEVAVFVRRTADRDGAVARGAFRDAQAEQPAVLRVRAARVRRIVLGQRDVAGPGPRHCAVAHFDLRAT